MSTTRTLIAAATLTIFAGAAAAEGEHHIDYTNMQSSTTRAEVMADAAAFKSQQGTAAFAANELYGSIDPQAVMSDSSREEVRAQAIDFRVDSMSNRYFVANEAYNGVPSLDVHATSPSFKAGE